MSPMKEIHRICHVIQGMRLFVIKQVLVLYRCVSWQATFVIREASKKIYIYIKLCTYMSTINIVNKGKVGLFIVRSAN